MSAMSQNRTKTGRPLPKTAFKPGQSGNPGGRPKKTPEMRRIEDLAREYSPSALAALADEAVNGKGQPRVAASIALLDRAWGTPVKREESGGPNAFSTDDERVSTRERLEGKLFQLGVVKVEKAKAA